VEAGVEPLTQLLRARKPVRSGRPTAQKRVALAKQSVSSGRAIAGRSVSLRILCDQLEHTQAKLARLETEIEQLLTNDPGVKGLQQVSEFGPKTVAVWRAELGDVQRFTRTDARDCLRGDGHRDQREREMEWQSQAFQTRQWFAATDVVCGGDAQHSFGRLGFRGLLSPPGRARPKVWFSFDGRHAQNAGGGRSLTQPREGGV
jgi:hypothetical protein